MERIRVRCSTSAAYCLPSMPNLSMASATRWMLVSSTGPIGIAGQRHEPRSPGAAVCRSRHGGLDRGRRCWRSPVPPRSPARTRPPSSGVSRPRLGGDIPVDGEVQGGALVEVGQHLLAVVLFRDGDVGLGEKRRSPVAVLQLPGHRRESLRVGDEIHLPRRDPVSPSSALISRVPMLLVPLTPIFLPARPAMVVMGEFARDDQRARVRPQGGGLGEDAEPGPRRLRRDVSDVAPGADVDLALQLVGDDRLAAGYLLDRHVQPLPGEQPLGPARCTGRPGRRPVWRRP